MLETEIIILVHQVIFQGMFITKNILLKKKIEKEIRGSNFELIISISLFTVFIAVAIAISFSEKTYGDFNLLTESLALSIGLGIIVLNLFVSLTSLLNIKDSWRVGVLEGQETELITSGIYRYSRNPYFVSYILMFAAYTIMLQNLILLGLSIFGIVFIHKMIIKEEGYLYSVHGDAYIDYIEKVPRYLVI